MARKPKSRRKPRPPPSTTSASAPPSPPPAGATTTTTTIESKATESSMMWTIFASLLPPLYICWRVGWSNRLPIMDCDEVYNYWEPLHYLMFDSGFQTWEYAHEFGLRTYAYLYPLCVYGKFLYAVAVPVLDAVAPDWPDLLVGKPSGIDSTLAIHTQYQHPVSHDRLATFLLLRASLAAFMAMAEVGFIRALRSRYGNSATTVPNLAGLFMLVSAGMCHMAGALLPSTTVTFCWLKATTAYLKHQPTTFIFWAVLATLAIGWPFGVVMFVPCGLGVLYRGFNGITDDTATKPASRSFFAGLLSVVAVLIKALVIAAIVQLIVLGIDYQEYGIIISPILNIFLYNTSSGGDELYGIEPLSYYARNLVLNFNVVAALGVASVPLWLVRGILGMLASLFVSAPKAKGSSSQQQPASSSKPATSDILTILLAMYVWLFVVVPRPHKEERFLFPVYPCLCLGGAWAVQQLSEMLASIFSALGSFLMSKPTSAAQKQKSVAWMSLMLGVLVGAASTVVSIGRATALSKYYMAPLSIYAQLGTDIVESRRKEAGTQESSSKRTKKRTTVCTCGEWYRFPSSFYLPEDVQLGFRPSSFDGQLPRPFTWYGSGPESVALTEGHFNDNNELTSGSWVESEEECDYMIDLWDSTDCLESDVDWTLLAQEPFLDAEQTSMLHRMVYIPTMHEAEEQTIGGEVKYTEYMLYKRRDPDVTSGGNIGTKGPPSPPPATRMS